MSCEIIRTEKRVARKSRGGCEWCRELVPAKEEYVSVVFRQDGDIYSASYHPECHEACKSVWAKFWKKPHMHPEDFGRVVHLRGSEVEDGWD